MVHIILRRLSHFIAFLLFIIFGNIDGIYHQYNLVLGKSVRIGRKFFLTMGLSAFSASGKTLQDGSLPCVPGLRIEQP